MIEFALRIAVPLLLLWILLQVYVTFRTRQMVDRATRALRTGTPATETPPLTEIRIQLTELGFTVGRTTSISDRVLSMIGFRLDGIVADSSDTTRPGHPASTGFLTVFEGGGLLATQRRRQLPIPDGDVVQVLPDAPIDELLAAHIRGCRLMETAGHQRVPTPDHDTALTLVVHEIDRIGSRLQRMSIRDRGRLLRSQLKVSSAGHILTTQDPLPPPPSAPAAPMPR